MSSTTTAQGRNKTAATIRRIGFWLSTLMAALLLLSAAVLLLAGYLLKLPEIQEKIRTVVAARTGISIEYRRIGISWLPAPAIELDDLVLSLPEAGGGKVGVLRYRPDLSALLSGALLSGRLEMIQPEVSIALHEPAGEGAGGAAEADGKDSEGFALTLLAGLRSAGLDLRVSDGRFTVTSGTSGTRKASGEGVELDLRLSLRGLQSGELQLESSLAGLEIGEGEKRERLQGIRFQGSAEMEQDDLLVQLEQLALADPALELKGSMRRTTEGIILDLSGRDIDVAGTRAKALALADTVTPIPEIFSYLIGGTVPAISFTAQGGTFSDLGEYGNFRLEGRLQKGEVAVPELALDLSEVEGSVVLEGGILRANGASARLGKTTGSSGTLALALAEESDLFQLEILLDADLAEAREVVVRLADNPELTEALSGISDLAGTASGKLLLGDSLQDVKVRVEMGDANLTLRHKALPFPVVVGSGKADLADDRVLLQGVNGTIGASRFSNLHGSVGWADEMQLDLALQESQAVLDELFPWLKKMDGLKPALAELKDLTGRLDLGGAWFKGDPSRPETWRYGASGAIKDIVVTTPLFPSNLSVPAGRFTVDGQDLTLQETEVKGLDGRLRLGGSLREWRVLELSLAGTLGSEIIAWLEKQLMVPTGYRLRTPVTLSGAALQWQKGKESRFSGEVAVAGGSPLTLTVTQGPEGLNLERLTIRGAGNETADLRYRAGKEGIEAGFDGSLRHETLDALFVHPDFGKGRLQGQVVLNIPASEKVGPTVDGRLNGTELVIPLTSGEELKIGQITLSSAGDRVRAEIGDLLWRDYLFNSITGTFVSLDKGLQVSLERAELCGVQATGNGSLAGEIVDFDLTVSGKGLDVNVSYTCLTQGEVRMTGSMEVTGRISGGGKPEELVHRLEGPLELRFAGGTIRQSPFMAAILEVLNVTEIVKGRLPSLTASGLPYNKIELDGRFGGGKFLFNKILMDGETLGLVGSGHIDLEQETLRVELLASPFRTVDSIIKRLPGISYLLGGSLVAIPLSVSGSLDNPKVMVMSPALVSKSLLNLGERTIKMPFKLIESIIPSGSGAKE